MCKYSQHPTIGLLFILSQTFANSTLSLVWDQLFVKGRPSVAAQQSLIQTNYQVSWELEYIKCSDRQEIRLLSLCSGSPLRLLRVDNAVSKTALDKQTT